MKTILHALVATLAIATLVPTDALANPQHERMKRCNAEAKEKVLKGDERKAFMSTCLKGKHDGGAVQAAAPAAAPVTATLATQPPAPPVAAPVTAVTPGANAAVDAKVATTAAPVASADKKKACNQAATEQSLSGAKRTAFLAECTKG